MKMKYNIKNYMPTLRILTIIIVMILMVKVSLFLYPFTIGIIIALFSKKITNIFSKFLKIDNKKINFLVITLIFCIIASLISYLVFLILMELLKLSEWIKINYTVLHRYGNLAIERYNSYSPKLPAYLQEYIKEGLNSFVGKFSDYIYQIINNIFVYIKYLPELIVSFVITIISTYIISNNMEEIRVFFKNQFPKSWLKKMQIVKTNSIDTLFTYIRSQAIIVSLVFVVMFVGYTIINHISLNIKYVLILSIISALLDALPLIGTGPLLQPWALYLFIQGNYKGAISILLIYIAVSIFRIFIEPYILTGSFDLHPFMSLLSMFVGFLLFGIIGFLLGPILFTVINIVFEDEIKLGFFKVLAGEKINEEKK